jgi:hypothetical protein
VVHGKTVEEDHPWAVGAVHPHVQMNSAGVDAMGFGMRLVGSHDRAPRWRCDELRVQEHAGIRRRASAAGQVLHVMRD